MGAPGAASVVLGLVSARHKSLAGTLDIHQYCHFEWMISEQI